MTYDVSKEEATRFAPSWGLLQLALALDLAAFCCDSTEEHHLTWEVSGANFNNEMPDDLVLQLKLDPHSAVVVLTHASQLYDMVLPEPLMSPAFYTGALGSRSNTSVRKERPALLTCHRRKSIACVDRLNWTLSGRHQPRLPCPSQKNL